MAAPWTLEIVTAGAWINCTDGTKLFYYDVPNAQSACEQLNRHNLLPINEPIPFEVLVDTKIINAVRMIKRRFPAHA